MTETKPKTLAEKRALIESILDAIVSAVGEGGSEGAPGSVLYIAMQEQLGFNLEEFNSIMRALCIAGRVEKRGQLYFLGRTEKGIE